MLTEARLENWGRAGRRKWPQGATKSFEGRFRSPQEWHALGAPPVALPPFDREDAEVINHAWQAMRDSFHQSLLVGWYVMGWSKGRTLREAQRVARVGGRSVSGFSLALAMARALLSAQLGVPAVVRADRLSARIRAELGLEALAKVA